MNRNVQNIRQIHRNQIIIQIQIFYIRVAVFVDVNKTNFLFVVAYEFVVNTPPYAISYMANDYRLNICTEQQCVMRSVFGMIIF